MSEKVKIKFYISNFEFDDDDHKSHAQIQRQITDWEEISKEDFEYIKNYKFAIETELRSTKQMGWSDHLMYTVDIQFAKSEDDKIQSIKKLIDDFRIKEADEIKREEKRREAAKIRAQAAKEKKLKSQYEKLKVKFENE